MRISTEQRTRRVLVVDDDEIVPLSLRHCGEKFGFNLDFIHARDMDEGVSRLNEQCFDAAVLDVCLPGGLSGVSFGEAIRFHDPHVPLAFLTNLDTDAVREQVHAQQALFLFKQTYIGSDEGLKALLGIICEMAQLNPCLPGGVRAGEAGFPRKLTATPIEIPNELRRLLDYGKMAMARAA